ncbi:RNA-binding protein [Mesorhizobium sp. WSM4884]|uniref:RNA-binding protein n=1 Tax=Mesorhizobium sp. WSM4884 TaxID=3038542 RepID=UPI002416322B|nr:RNA-binding protein [Mesorhizobium sp. WSM4884]MDG4881927.1 RNA-binding protein [Mesorhizobium sp. WSM4884]
MSLSRYCGVYWPADLDMLQRVFDRLCDERRLAKKDREQREFLAVDGEEIGMPPSIGIEG